MSVGIDIRSPDLELLAAAIPALKKQMPFALATAMNNTLKDVQAFTLRELLPDKFTLRAKGAPWHKPGTKFGFNLKFANKNNLLTSLASGADWLKHQESGGTKTGGAHRIAVPTKFWKRREEIMAKEKKPKALIKLMGDLQRRAASLTASDVVSKRGKLGSARTAKALSAARNSLLRAAGDVGSAMNRPFFARGKLHPGIYVRTGKARLPIKALFSFVDTAKITKPLNFEPTAEKRALLQYQKRFQSAMVDALLTAKMK